MPGRPLSDSQQINSGQDDDMNGDDLTESMVDAAENGCDDDNECLVKT